MCGITGVYTPGRFPDENSLEAMNDRQSHRGPDEEGTFLDDGIGLAHKRLSIVGPDTGQQPLFNEDGSVCVVFNGEIYNYDALRETLADHGHSFATDTDTEVLVHLYEDYGPSFVEQLEGMFAFALWDVTDERLLLARDPMGIKPLLVADDGESMAFASELPALLESNVDHGGIDERSIAQYFSLGYIPAPRSAFANVAKLEPGELRVVDRDGVDRSRFYAPTVESRDVSFEEAAAGIRTRVEDAIEKRLMSDVPLGAFLSGGLDSSIVVGTMAEMMDEPVDTFTVGFEESLFDESWAAREVAEYHGTNHTEHTVTADAVGSAISDVLDRMGEPFADQSIVPTYILARETSKEVKVAHSGDGSDELFAGYDRYRGEYYSKYYRKLPRTLRRSVVEPLTNRLETTRGDVQGERIRKIQKFLRGGEPNTAKRHFGWARISDDRSLETIRTVDPAAEGQQVLDAEHDRIAARYPRNRLDPMTRIQAIDTHFGLPNQILRKTDRASMYNSLEVRVPFLDTDVVEYAMSLPTSYKITPRTQKRVLKRAFDDVLPPSILQRKKQGFDMPIGEWFKHGLRDDFERRVTGLESELVDTGAVMDRFREHSNGREEHGKFLWSVYVFARWHDRMVEQDVI